jgi:hypothetical protein
LCCRVCVAAPRFAVAAVCRRSTAWDCFSGLLLVFVRLATLRTCARYRRVAVGERRCACAGGGGGDRGQSMLRICATDTCPAIVHVAVAVLHCCSVRGGSDCNTVLQVLCVLSGVAALYAAARGRGRVCNAAPPLCVTSLVMSVLSVQCSGVCSCGAVYLGVCVYVSLRFP